MWKNCPRQAEVVATDLRWWLRKVNAHIPALHHSYRNLFNFFLLFQLLRAKMGYAGKAKLLDRVENFNSRGCFASFLNDTMIALHLQVILALLLG